MTNTLRSVGGGTPRPKRAALHLYAAPEAWNLSPLEGRSRTTYGVASRPQSRGPRHGAADPGGSVAWVDVTPGPLTSPVGGPNPGGSMFTLTPAIRRPVDFDPDATATPYPWPIVVHRGPSVDELRELLACGWIGRAVGERFQMTEGAVRWRARCKS